MHSHIAIICWKRQRTRLNQLIQMRNSNTLRGLGSADFFVLRGRGALWYFVGSLMNLRSLEKLVISYLLKLLNFTNPLITTRLEKSVYQHSFCLSFCLFFVIVVLTRDKTTKDRKDYRDRGTKARAETLRYRSEISNLLISNI